MADVDDVPVEQVFEPSSVRVQHGPATSYPWLFSFTGEDVLILTSWNSATGARLAVQGRVYTKDQGVKPFRTVHVPNTDRSQSSTIVDVPQGELLNVVVFAEAGTTRIGETFIRLGVRRGRGTAETFLGTLLQGNCTQLQVQAWPGTPITNSLDGQGLTRRITGSDPAVGNFMNEVVPTGAIWQLLTFNATLSNGAGVNITPDFLIDDGGATVFYRLRTIYQTAWALTQFNYTWGAGHNTTVPAVATSTLTQGFSNDVLLRAGERIRVESSGLNDWSAPVYIVREWLEAQ